MPSASSLPGRGRLIVLIGGSFLTFIVKGGTVAVLVDADQRKGEP